MTRILVVDDDPDQRDNLEWAARAPGREVVTAQSAREAAEKISGNNFDVVVTDLQMDGEEAGLEVLRAAKEKNGDTQTILCTAYGTRKISLAALRLGVFDYLERVASGTDFVKMLQSKINVALEFKEAKSKASGQSIFGPPREDYTWPEVFVLMPFSPEMKAVYENHIKKVVTGTGLQIERADDFYKGGIIMGHIWSAIWSARIIVADCTKRNPNVLYEIGLAHAIGKNTILITQSLKDIPFDLQHLRVIEYKYTPPGMQEFEKALTATISEQLRAHKGAGGGSGALYVS